MPRFEPFPGLRYDPDRVRLADVVAPPYDVIEEDERASLQGRSPFNSVRVDLPDGEDGLDPYAAAARRLSQWQAGGVLRADPAPALYGYRMTYLDRTGRHRQTTGVIGALGLEPPGAAGIFPHEQTTPKAKSDRLQLIRATQLNTSPIWGLSLAPGLSEALAPAASSPGWSCSAVLDDEGVQHESWPITDPVAIDRISSLVSAGPVVIADGHHRFETALTYQRERQAATAAEGGPTSGAPTTGSPADSVMALVVELVEDQLEVHAIHRLLSGLPVDFDLPRALAEHFELSPVGEADATLVERIAAHDSMALATPDGTWLLRARPATVSAARQDLDASRLEVARTALPTHEVTYQPGWDRAIAAVERGDAQAAVLLRPVTVEQIAATGRGGERMPPKTTFFWPKPRTGLVFRSVRG